MNGFKLAVRLAMNEHEIRLKHISKCQTIQIFSACLGMMHKIYLSTLSHMPWYVLTPHSACFGLIQIRKGGKKSQYNLDYQQPHPLWPWQFPGESKACVQWHFLWPICSSGGIAGWNMEYEWLPPPLRASIRDHLRGPGPLLRGCGGVWSCSLWSQKWWWSMCISWSMASLYHYDQCVSKNGNGLQ